MAQLPIPQLNPEEQELNRKRARLAELEAELAEQELKRATLLAKLNAFEKRYLEVVGRRYAELDRLEAEIASFLARQKPNDPVSQERAEAARKRARESAESVTDDAGAAASDKTKRPESLRKLYRESAKLLHPDLTLDPDEKERRKKAMAEFNEAYAAGDEERMRAILRDWHASPENVQGDGPGAELVRTIRKIAQVENRLEAIAEEIDQLRQSNLFKLRQAAKKAWAEGGNLLTEMTRKVDAEIASARKRLETLRQGGKR